MSKYAIAVSETGKKTLVNAEENVVPKVDTNKLTFHVFPRLFLPAWVTEDFELNEELKRMSLRVYCSQLGGDLTPPGGIVFRRPYPNDRYVIAGTCDRKMGWFVEMNQDNCPEELELLLEWKFEPDSLLFVHGNTIKIFQELKLKLERTEIGHVFSMKRPYFQKNAASIVAVLEYDDFVRFARSKDNHYDDFDFFYDEFKHVDGLPGYYIRQSLKLTSCAESDLLLDEFENATLLRDLKHQATFNKGVQDHIDASSCEIPAQFLIEAVRTALAIPFDDKNSPYYNNLESHPSMKMLSDWWNNNAPKNHCAASIMPWVRVSEEDEEDENNRYWCGYYENPNLLPTDYFCADSTARCGNAILIVFAKSRRSAYYDKDDCIILEEVGGQIFEKVGINLEEYDPAWYSLVALTHFPTRFPAAWAALKSLDNR